MSSETKETWIEVDDNKFVRISDVYCFELGTKTYNAEPCLKLYINNLKELSLSYQLKHKERITSETDVQEIIDYGGEVTKAISIIDNKYGTCDINKIKIALRLLNAPAQVREDFDKKYKVTPY